MDEKGERSARGTLLPGHRPLPGAGRPRNAITNALRRMTEPEEIAKFLLDTVKSTHLPMKVRLQAAEIVYDRLEGRPTQSLSVTAQVAQGTPLPPSWELMTSDERAAYLDELAGPLALPSGR